MQLLERAKQITGLTAHPRFSMVVHGILVGHYTADASYHERGKYVVEDTKSPATARTEAYRLRVKLFKALYPEIEHREV